MGDAVGLGRRLLGGRVDGRPPRSTVHPRFHRTSIIRRRSVQEERRQSVYLQKIYANLCKRSAEPMGVIIASVYLIFMCVFLPLPFRHAFAANDPTQFDCHHVRLGIYRNLHKRSSLSSFSLACSRSAA